MPLGPVAWGARTGRRISVAAAAAVLQGAFCWFLGHEAAHPPASWVTRPLRVTMIETARRLKPAAPPSRETHIAPRQMWQPPAPRIPLPAYVEPITQPRTSRFAPRASIDWRQQLRAEARQRESRTPARQLNFGFPRRPDRARPAPQFEWDHAATHRMEPLPGGGTLINLSDRCALVMYGILIPVCKIGRIPVNGALFEHLHDPSNDRSDGLP